MQLRPVYFWKSNTGGAGPHRTSGRTLGAGGTTFLTRWSGRRTRLTAVVATCPPLHSTGEADAVLIVLTMTMM